MATSTFLIGTHVHAMRVATLWCSEGVKCYDYGTCAEHIHKKVLWRNKGEEWLRGKDNRLHEAKENGVPGMDAVSLIDYLSPTELDCLELLSHVRFSQATSEAPPTSLTVARIAFVFQSRIPRLSANSQLSTYFCSD